MNKAQLIESLQQMQELAQECLKSLGIKSSKPKSPATLAQNTRSTLPEHILKLRAEGFFAQPRTAQETHAKLAPIYACDVKRVMVALLRLKKGRELRKASKTLDGKRQAAYVW